MIIELNDEFYALAKTVDFSYMGEHIKFDDEKNQIVLDDCDIKIKDYRGFYFIESSLSLFLSCITDEVCRSGLSDDQNEVLPRGRQLYALHDSIYYSLPVKKGE